MQNPPTVKVPLRNRADEIVAYALVDAKDATLAQYRWSQLATGYAVSKTGQRTSYMHRVVLGLTAGDGIEVDHINGDRSDNRRMNLRQTTRAQNAQNIMRSTGTSEFRGVSWRAQKQKWQAGVRLNGRQKHLGYFDDELEAAKVASEWRLAHMPYTNEDRTLRKDHLCSSPRCITQD